MTLTLDPKEGVAPRLGVCQWCGEDVGIVLMGSHHFKTTCRTCQIVLYGGGKCPRCGAYGSDRQEITEMEKVPMGLCATCDARKREMIVVVARGGVYWRCVDCHSNGAVEGDVAVEARVQAQIPRGPMGIEITKVQCPHCREAASRGITIEQLAKEQYALAKERGRATDL